MNPPLLRALTIGMADRRPFFFLNFSPKNLMRLRRLRRGVRGKNG